MHFISRASMFRLFAVLTLTTACTAALAQTNRGSLSGTVIDQNGGVAPGAKVVVTNIGTNQALTLITSGEGAYTASALEPALYRVSVELPGFKRAVVNNIKVDTATATTVNVTLEVGAPEVSVTVTADTPLVNSESGTTGQTITERQIVDLPLNNRSVLDLALTVPDVTGEVGTEDPQVTTAQPNPGGGLTIGGGRVGTSTILADGVNNTGVGLSRAVVSFSPDVVQEFRVQTSAFSAEFGQTGGGIVNATTKSGTNEFKGTLYWYNRNPLFGAGDFTTATVNRPVPSRRQNQFGAIIGGPIKLPKPIFGPLGYDGRDRSFFFVSYEPRYYSDGTTVDALVPTEAMRRGDFSNLVNVGGGAAPADVVRRFGLTPTGDVAVYQYATLVGNQLQALPLPASGSYAQFPGNVIPQAYLDPTAQKILPYVPLPGEYFLNSNGELRNWAGVRNVKNDEKRLTLRFDHSLTNANRLNFRFTRVPIIGVRRFSDENEVNALVSDYSASKQILLGDTHVFSPTVINDLRVNYTRGNFSRSDPPTFQKRNLSTELGLPSATEAGLPYFFFGLSEWANPGQKQVTLLQDNIENSYNIANTLSWTRGTQTFKFGADLRDQRLKTVPFYGATGGNWRFSAVHTDSNGPVAGGSSGNSFASSLLGIVNQVTLRNSVIPYYYQWKSAAFFVQNDWKLKPNLTLNLGLRYSLQLPRTEKYDRQGSFLPELAAEVALPAPITLPSGRVVTKALVPPFVFAGRGGRSRYLTPVDKLGFEPRFGFAWSPAFSWNQNNRFLVRGGYGLSHIPLTGLGNTPDPDFAGTDSTFTFNSGQVNPNFLTRLSSNQPNLILQTPDQVVNVPSDGLVTLGSINIPGFVVDPNFKVPYVQNWNLSASYLLFGNTSIEAAYVGAKGTHLFTPPLNINAVGFEEIEATVSAGLSTSQNVADPLGRRTTTGAAVTMPRLSLASQYLGFNRLDLVLNPSANSIRHAGYVSLQRRFSRGLAFTANYTYGKGLDEASDSSGAYVGSINSAGRTDGHQTFGAPRRSDRSVSTFDVKHNFASTFIYDD